MCIASADVLSVYIVSWWAITVYVCSNLLRAIDLTCSMEPRRGHDKTARKTKDLI